MAWNALRGLFDGETRAKKSLQKQIQKLLSKSHQHEDRLAAIDAMVTARTPEALAALFRRYDMQADKEREDRAEKDYLAQVLAGLGEEAIPAFRDHLERSPNLVLPAQAMRPILGDENLVGELVRVLVAEIARIAAFKPERKVRLIQILSEFDDARILPAVRPALADFDESVRFEAAALLGRRGEDDDRHALIQRLLDPVEDSARVKGGILTALAARRWPIEAERAPKGRNLAPGWSLDEGGVPVRH